MVHHACPLHDLLSVEAAMRAGKMTHSAIAEMLTCRPSLIARPLRSHRFGSHSGMSSD